MRPTTRVVLIAAAVLTLGAGVARAAHPTVEPWEAVQGLAHELENTARRLHRDAERFAHHGDRREEAALRRIHELEDRARHFHREVERYYRDPRHTHSDFRALEHAYYRAAEARYWLHGIGRVEVQFERVDRLMYELTERYERWVYGPGRAHYRGNWYRRWGWAVPHLDLRFYWRH